jgi:5'-nucleotidase
LLTNDDGINATGLRVLRRALLRVPGIDLQVVAPDGNRSATARSITTRRPLWVEEFDFGEPDEGIGYATDGTPVDCVRLARLGVTEPGWTPDLVVAGINHGSNLGDDITYSGTVAAAFEGIVLGIPALAVSQQSDARELDFRQSAAFDFRIAAEFTARLVIDLEQLPLPPATLLNVNVPGCEPEGVTVARLGKRIYTDELVLVDEELSRRRYRVYGEAGFSPEEEGTDIAALAAGQIAITPLHLDVTHHDGIDALAAHQLERLLREPAESGSLPQR